jgi:hypothetical protein
MQGDVICWPMEQLTEGDSRVDMSPTNAFDRSRVCLGEGVQDRNLSAYGGEWNVTAIGCPRRLHEQCGGVCLGIIRELPISEACSRIRCGHEECCVGVVDCMEVERTTPAVLLEHGYFGHEFGIVRGSFEDDRGVARANGGATDVVVTEREVWSQHEIPLARQFAEMCR